LPIVESWRSGSLAEIWKFYWLIEPALRSARACAEKADIAFEMLTAKHKGYKNAMKGG